MKVKCLNNSSKKTKEMIRKEFANLLAEKKEFNKVTVTELVKNIGITRGSFYSHYDSLDEVAKEFQNEALDVLREDINSISDIEYFLDKINLFLKENNNLYSSVLKTNDAMIFMERLNKLANAKLVERCLLPSKYNHRKHELFFNYTQPYGNYKITCKWMNPIKGADIWIRDVITYTVDE